jgi:hypothetical protein
MPALALVIEVSGEIDFDGAGPILVEDNGRRWQLEDGSSLLIGDYVRLAATKQDFNTLRVRAVMEEEFAPVVRARSARTTELASKFSRLR